MLILTPLQKKNYLMLLPWKNRHPTPKVPGSSPAATYMQRRALCSNWLPNVEVSVKQVEVVVRSLTKCSLPSPAVL